MRSMFGILLHFAFIFLMIPTLFADNTWELAKTKNNIKIYTRPAEGLDIKPFKGVTTIQAPLEVLHEILNDSQKFKDWFGDCLHQKTTQQINANSKYIYQTIYVPLLKNRNIVGKVEFNPDYKNGTLKATITALTKDKIPDAFQETAWHPETSKYVRITNLKCTFNITSKGPNTSEIEYEVFADMNSSVPIPEWVANHFALNNPLFTLSKLKEMVKKDIYWDKAAQKHPQKNFSHKG